TYCMGTIAFASSILTPIMMDFVKPRNESRTRLIKYFMEFSHEQTIYVDILSFGCIFIFTIGFLSTTSTESMLNIMAYYLSGLFKITRVNALSNCRFLCTHEKLWWKNAHNAESARKYVQLDYNSPYI
ncbi:unnamed protein product, partial [Heterotrigona itama]